MKTNLIHVYLPQGFADWEVGHAMAYLNQHPHQFMPTPYSLRTVGETRAAVRSMGGLTLLPDLTLAELQPADSALLILPGGSSWDAEGNVAAAEKAREFVTAGVPVAAICGATAGLARVGLLDDRKHTSNAADYLAATGYAGKARYVDAPVVRDGGVITAASTAPVAFAAAIFEALDLYTPEVRAAWSGLFSTGEAQYYHALVGALGGAESEA
ncbi:MAG TPA: type 1 glutamine amidotransferase family protein [Polyangiaceae bacterium]